MNERQTGHAISYVLSDCLRLLLPRQRKSPPLMSNIYRVLLGVSPDASLCRGH